ncbi:unnamed protein product [Meloidogyne enterolobii]|uniref:Uncharacterized protein n=1 Tax=Meloidogyne enterolobii TaxID=390850 RepID=A0ACB1A1A9_MELEN
MLPFLNGLIPAEVNFIKFTNFYFFFSSSHYLFLRNKNANIKTKTTNYILISK